MRASAILEVFQEKVKNKYKDKKSVTLDKEEADELKKIANEIRLTLLPETSGLVAYIVSDKRYRVEVLTVSISGIFCDEYTECVPEIANYDFQEAGKCIAFDAQQQQHFIS